MTTLGIQWLAHQEQVRHNRALEQETHRTNVANEDLKGAQITVDVDKAIETARHNRKTESLQDTTNIIDYGYKQGLLQNDYNKLIETRRHNQTSEQEAKRSNQANEQIQASKVFTDMVTSLAKSLSDVAKAAI